MTAASNPSGPVTRGAHHIGLTVPDLQQTLRFFIETLGFQQVGEKPDYPAVFLSDGTTMITLWQVRDPATAVAFDRRNVIGLHHVALAVENAEALQALQVRLEEAEGVVMEFAAEPLGEAPLRHMMCAIPGGIRMEFIAPAA